MLLLVLKMYAFFNSRKEFEIRLTYYDKGRKKRGIKESAIYATSFPVKSLAGNNWILFIQKSASAKKYTGIESASLLAVTYHYCEKGITAFYLTETNIIVGFNPHFFDRYNERMQLNLEHSLDIVRAFFKKGIYCQQGTIKVDGKKQLIAFRADGFQLGHYYVKDGYIEWRTFV
ncbi:MAG: hypothetical protein M3015_10555, partial [Bacteroidota bacterium]|nr:hypothetical protein [Bacteroidota bacterium]